MRGCSGWRSMLRAGICVAALVVAGCGGDEPASGPDADAEQEVAEAGPVPDGAVGPAPGGMADLSAWLDPERAPSRPAGDAPPEHAIEVPPVAPRPDADAVIERFATECGDGTSPQCRALRLEVEQVFLADIVGLRAAAVPVDRDWYRVAAVARTPQLACLGLRELIHDPQRTPADETLIVAALDSPYRAVRGAVLTYGQGIAAVKALMPRVDRDAPQAPSYACTDGARDAEPAAKWAGGYPGARFRHFASGPLRRWFTTPDSPERVLAWLSRGGEPARTAEELQEAAGQKMMAEYMEAMQDPAAADEARFMEMMQRMAAGQVDWTRPFASLEGAGEVRYVMVAPGQALAVFRDDLLGATSIVAARPESPEVPAGMEEAQRAETLRRILGI